MPASCTAPGCCNSGYGTKSGRKGLRMVRYPKDDILRKRWLEIIERPNWTPYSGARLCEAHFSRDQWKSPFLLKEDAVPLPNPTFGCSCEGRGTLVTALADHSYSRLSSQSCKVHGRWSEAEEIIQENCALQNKVYALQKQLTGGDCKDTFSNPLASVENIKTMVKSRTKFSPEDIKKGLQLRFSCGTAGYNTVREVLGDTQPLPSVRLLQHSTENLKFAPGILEEVFEPMKARFESLKDERDHDVTLVFDELAIKRRVDYDNGLKKFIGHATLPGHEHLLAEKGEIFVIRGCHRKFKQIVAYHLNPSTVQIEQKKQVILELIRRAKEVGANVVALVCDMGNRGLLSALGFCTQKNSLKYCIPNPVDSNYRLWCVADVVHVFKALKGCLCGNRFMELPAWVVSQFDLSSAMVDIEHIEWLEKFQRDESLQLVPGLTLKDLNTTHFSKMKVKSSHKVVNHKVASSLSYLVLKGLVPASFETTAWFVKLMNRWFELTTSRSCLVALGLKNQQAYNEAINHLNLVIRVFEGLKISGGWKPVQSHIIFTTKSLLEIQDYLINDRKYQFLFTGNFTSDVVENVVSKIRMTNPTPSGLELKNRLKHLVISHYNKNISTSSYDHDDAEDLVDLLLKQGERLEGQTPQQEEIDIVNFKWNPVIPSGAINSTVDDILYRMCGYVITSLWRRKILNCQQCFESLRHKGEVPHPNAIFLIVTDYIPGAQFAVTDILFRLLRLIEFNLIQWIPKLQGVQCLQALIDAVVKPAVAPYFPLETCHDIKMKIVQAFCIMRFRQLGVQKFSPSESLTSTALSSKTAGGQYLTSKHVNKSQDATPKRKPEKPLKRLLTLP